MLILRPDLSEGDVEGDLQALQEFLEANGATDVMLNLKGRQRMASPIKGEWNGIYVLVMFCAPRKVSKLLQDRLSAPDDTNRIMRFLTTRP